MKVRVEDLVAAALTGHAPSDQSARWLRGLDGDLRDKLGAVGLAAKGEKSTLGAFVDAYTDGRTDAKDSTGTVYKRARRHLVGFFGENKPMREITPGDADDWRLHLIEKGPAENTIRRSVGMARRFFRAAERRELVSANPFADLPASVKASTGRYYFVSREEAARTLDACPDAEWRLLFTLCRYAGLRCPSETLALRWGDIDWERGRMMVPSPKTEHHGGGESRAVPIFPELMPYLREMFEQAEEGAEHRITRYRDSTTNLRTQLQRIIRKAGLEPWPKLWQNLRSTRETELAESFPMHVVCAWIGNSQPVAARSYLPITDEHFERAAQSGASVLRNPVQQPRASRSNEKKIEAETPAQVGSLRNTSKSCNDADLWGMGVAGLEPATPSL